MTVLGLTFAALAFTVYRSLWDRPGGPGASSATHESKRDEMSGDHVRVDRSRIDWGNSREVAEAIAEGLGGERVTVPPVHRAMKTTGQVAFVAGGTSRAARRRSEPACAGGGPTCGAHRGHHA